MRKRVSNRLSRKRNTYDGESNKEREIGGLMEAMSEFKLKEGLILTQEQEEELRIKGKKIKVMPLWKWLLE